MAYTVSSTNRSSEKDHDPLMTWKAAGGQHASSVVLTDAAEAQVGIVGAPLYVSSRSSLAANSDKVSRSFSWSNATYNYSAADTILLVQNSASARNLIVDQIWCHSDTTTRVIIHATNEASLTHSGTSVTGVNLNRASSNTAEATATADEVNNVQGNILFAGSISSDSSAPMLVNAGIILDLNDIIAVDFVDVGGEALVTIHGHYEDD